MATTTQEQDMTTTENKTITYGTAAYGGKVHQISYGKAVCLSGNGYKNMHTLVAVVCGIDSTYPSFEERAAALISVGVGSDHVCKKCCNRVSKIMKGAGA